MPILENRSRLDNCFEPHATLSCFRFHRRLLTDDSPRIRAALRSFLYGSDNLLKVRMASQRENSNFSQFPPFPIGCLIGGRILPDSFSSPHVDAMQVERVNEMVQAYRDFNEAFGGFVPTKATPALQRPAGSTQSRGYVRFSAY